MEAAAAAAAYQIQDYIMRSRLTADINDYHVAHLPPTWTMYLLISPTPVGLKGIFQPCDDADRDFRDDLAENAMVRLKSPMDLALFLRIYAWLEPQTFFQSWTLHSFFKEFIKISH